MIVHSQVGLWDILYFPLLGFRGAYLLIFFRGFKGPTRFGRRDSRARCDLAHSAKLTLMVMPIKFVVLDV